MKYCWETARKNVTHRFFLLLHGWTMCRLASSLMLVGGGGVEGEFWFLNCLISSFEKELQIWLKQHLHFWGSFFFVTIQFLTWHSLASMLIVHAVYVKCQEIRYWLEGIRSLCANAFMFFQFPLHWVDGNQVEKTKT